MLKIDIFVESRYPVNRKIVRKSAIEELKKAKNKNAVVSIAFIGDRKMGKLNKEYRDKDGSTPVLAFSQSEGKPFPGTEGAIHLGDIVVSYPQARDLAKQYNKLVDTVIEDLVKHGVKQIIKT